MSHPQEKKKAPPFLHPQMGEIFLGFHSYGSQELAKEEGGSVLSSLGCQSLEKVTASLPARKKGSLTVLSRITQEGTVPDYCRKDVSVIFFLRNLRHF